MRNQAEEDPMAKATIAAEDLYHIRDTYFTANLDEKISKLQKQSDLALKLLDSVPSGHFSLISITSISILCSMFVSQQVKSSVHCLTAKKIEQEGRKWDIGLFLSCFLALKVERRNNLNKT